MLAYWQVICCMFAHIQSSFAKCHDRAISPQAGFIIYNLQSKYYHGGQIVLMDYECTTDVLNDQVLFSIQHFVLLGPREAPIHDFACSKECC